MAVKVHGVRGEELVLDDEVDPLVGGGKGDGVGDQTGTAVRRGGAVAVDAGVADAAGAGVAANAILVKGLERGLRVVDTDGVVIQEPAEDGAAVAGGNSCDVTSRQGRGSRRESAGRPR